MPSDTQTDKVIKMFWQSFPDRKAASRILAAMTLLSHKIGAEATMDLAKRLARTVETNGTSAVLSFERDGNACCVIAPVSEDRSEAAMLEHVMDHLVMELRERKHKPVTVGQL